MATKFLDLTGLTSVLSRLKTLIAAKQDKVSGGASTILSSNLTASRALVSNASGKVAVSPVTSTELGYLDGVTSNIQTQLNGKAAKNHTHTASEITDLSVGQSLGLFTLYPNIMNAAMTANSFYYGTPNPGALWGCGSPPLKVSTLEGWILEINGYKYIPSTGNFDNSEFANKMNVGICCFDSNLHGLNVVYGGEAGSVWHYRGKTLSLNAGTSFIGLVFTTNDWTNAVDDIYSFFTERVKNFAFYNVNSAYERYDIDTFLPIARSVI